jgi:two-component system, response regulator PdtaR
MMRVLIVEDEPLIALSLASELKLAGHHVLGPSADADEALCLAGDHHADLALISADLQGGMGGTELARLLQSQCEVPALLLTTQPSTMHADTDAFLGMITLPFDPAEISDLIRAAQAVIGGDQPVATSVPQSLRLFH